MAGRSYLPNNIKRIYDEHPNKHNTNLQLQVADFIEDNWGPHTGFKDLAEAYQAETGEEKDRSETIRRVWHDYFGPVDDPAGERTFSEIAQDVKEQLGHGLSDSQALKEYWKARGEIGGGSEYVIGKDESGEDLYTEEEIQEIREKEYRRGVRDGHQDGYEQGRKSVLEELPREVVLEELGRDALEHANNS